jgi:2-phosphoglycerate kinase
LQTDDLWFALQRATNSDERPALHFFARTDVWELPVQELFAAKRDLAEEISSSLESVIANHVHHRDRLVIEGVWITPTLASRRSFAGYGYGDAVRAVFVDEQDEQAILDALLARGRGFEEWPTTHQRAMAGLQARYGEWLHAEAERCGIPLVAARPVETLVDRIAGAILV